jgi:hypothetical protein
MFGIFGTKEKGFDCLAENSTAKIQIRGTSILELGESGIGPNAYCVGATGLP